MSVALQQNASVTDRHLKINAKKKKIRTKENRTHERKELVLLINV